MNIYWEPVTEGIQAPNNLELTGTTERLINTFHLLSKSLSQIYKYEFLKQSVLS